MVQRGEPPFRSPRPRTAVKVAGSRARDALTAHEPSREQLHLLLDVALNFAERTAGSSDPEDTRRLARVVQQLLQGAFGALRERVMGPPGDTQPADKPQADVRRDLVKGLTLPSLMPVADRKLLAHALLTLNRPAADVPPLFHRAPKKGRGADPKKAMFAETLAWEWIWQEHARTGAPIGRLKMQVAKATGITPEAVEKWRQAWMRRDGKDVVQAARDMAELMGRSWPKGDVEGSPAATARLHHIAEHWKAGRLPDKARARPPRWK